VLSAGLGVFFAPFFGPKPKKGEGDKITAGFIKKHFG
jgi:hypothetical protein